MNTKIYQSGLKFMLCNAVKKLYKGEVLFHHSLDHGIYASIVADKDITRAEIDNIKKCMHRMVENNLPFKKIVVGKKEAFDFFMKKGYSEKAQNVLNISNLTISLFELEGQYNYFYSHDMPKSTGLLDKFDIYYIKDNEIVLIYPMDNVLTFEFRKSIYESFHEYDTWVHRLGIQNVSDVNRIIAQGGALDLVKKNDITIDNNLYTIAKDIVAHDKRIVLLAGPSSSGKTTTSKKLALYLSALGYKALSLSLDDFFVNREDTPLGSDGQPDFECLEAIDLETFNQTIAKLLAGKEVKMPKFDFITGKRFYADKGECLGKKDILVIEGLHAINPKLISHELKDLSYKVYISPLTPLTVDRHNYVSTTDNRLLRRIVRDFKTRGRTAEETLALWNNVRRGEEKYIFPYTDTVDAILNTAYIYEIGVLKIYVEPLLYSIGMDSPYYYEARRLLDHLKTFYPLPSEYVSGDNLLREFIGGSNYEE